MQNSQKTVIGVIVGLIILVGVVAWYQDYAEKRGTDNEMAATSSEEAQEVPVTVNVKHLYTNGTHAYRGIVETPTPCYDVSATSTPTLGGEYSILITTKDRGGACAQVIASKDFSLSFKAPEDVSIIVLLNGKLARFNTIEVDREEDLLGPFDFKS